MTPFIQIDPSAVGIWFSNKRLSSGEILRIDQRLTEAIRRSSEPIASNRGTVCGVEGWYRRDVCEITLQRDDGTPFNLKICYRRMDVRSKNTILVSLEYIASK